MNQNDPKLPSPDQKSGLPSPDQNAQDPRAEREARGTFVVRKRGQRLDESPALRQISIQKVAQALDEQDGQRILVKSVLSDPETHRVSDPEKLAKIDAILSRQIDKLYKISLLEEGPEQSGILQTSQVAQLLDIKKSLLESPSSPDEDEEKEETDEQRLERLGKGAAE